VLVRNYFNSCGSNPIYCKDKEFIILLCHFSYEPVLCCRQTAVLTVFQTDCSLRQGLQITARGPNPVREETLSIEKQSYIYEKLFDFVERDISRSNHIM